MYVMVICFRLRLSGWWPLDIDKWFFCQYQPKAGSIDLWCENMSSVCHMAEYSCWHTRHTGTPVATWLSHRHICSFMIVTFQTFSMTWVECDIRFGFVVLNLGQAHVTRAVHAIIRYHFKVKHRIGLGIILNLTHYTYNWRIKAIGAIIWPHIRGAIGAIIWPHIGGAIGAIIWPHIRGAIGAIIWLGKHAVWHWTFLSKSKLG